MGELCSDRCGDRNVSAAVRIAAFVLAILTVGGCGEKDESAPLPSDPASLVERAAERTLAAGPSEAKVLVRGRRSYSIDETLDPESGWYLANEPPRAEGRLGNAKPAVRWPPITGPLLELGASDIYRAYVAFGLGRRTCWTEAHAPAGSIPGTASAEEALVTLHTALVLLTANIVRAEPLDLRPGYRVRIAAPGAEDITRLEQAVTGDPGLSSLDERRQSAAEIVRGLRQPIVVELGPNDHLHSLSMVLRGGQSPLSFTGPRPASTLVLRLSGVGAGQPVAKPKCRGIE